ncbi:hypothetical protein DXG01_016150 [Tephrocybe rancida]|nr:hypothetical protein DXG01_016150 [Tephrocybe rancida]
MAATPNTNGYYGNFQASQPATSVAQGDVSGSVRTLLLAAKRLQELLKQWSISRATDTQVSDAYVQFGTDFNATITAFAYHKIDLSDIHSVPGDLRVSLEQCLSNDPSPAVLELHMPEVRRALYKLYEGIQARKDAWRAAAGGMPAHPPRHTLTAHLPSQMASLISTNLPGLTLLGQGKVRDVYATSSPDHLLFVATDRISAYDVILKNGIPDKGKLLTQLSLFWFQKLDHVIPNHFVTANVEEMPEEVRQYKDQLDGRAMLVKKATVVPLEAIVRGYLSGSAWNEYKKSGTVHGITVPAGLVESDKFPEPIFTPSTKAEQGAHDENISPQQGAYANMAETISDLPLNPAAKLIGEELYTQISTAALQLYKTAADYAFTRGVILADTKFEFGLITSPSGEKSVILIDELLTPDSSRYWPLSSYAPGGPQPSFDKQYVRDWLVSQGFRKGLESGPEGHEGEGWVIEESVVAGTRARYAEVVEVLMK